MNAEQSNLYTISGNDEFTIRQKATEVLEALCGTPPEDNPNLEIVHGDSTEMKPNDMINEIINSVNTPAFFGDSKVIWLKRFDFTQISKSNVMKEVTGNLVDILKAGVPDDVILVLDGTGLDRRSALFKACKQSGEVHHFEKIDLKNRDWEQSVRAKIMSECQQRGYSIAPDAAAFLTETSGTDVGRVVSEIDKVTAFIYPRNNITIDDCKSICSMTPEAAGWAFADALGEKNLVKAMDTLNVLFNNKSYGVQVLYSVIGRFQEMVSIKTAAQKLAIPPRAQYSGFKSRVENIHPQLKDSLKGHTILKMHPYRAFMLFAQSAKFADAKLAEILTHLIKVNRQLVSGGCDERIALEMLAIKICK
jgi:DNA polymerase III delta subunit